MNNQTLQTLYESDFQVWVEKTIDCLEKQQFNHLDIQHLIEELTDLGRSDRKELESNLENTIKKMIQWSWGFRQNFHKPFFKRGKTFNPCFNFCHCRFGEFNP
ncbi:MAG: DUF29 family protein, partial [Snowella sp.]